MSDLKPCPFCGEPLSENGTKHNPYAKCATRKCKWAQLPVLNLDDQFDIDRWNNRPHENKIKAEAIREAAKELCEFRGIYHSVQYDEIIDYANKLENGEL